MKRISEQKNSFLKRLLLNIPFVLIVAATIAAFGGGLILAIYSIATAIAFKSAMISLILIGAGLLLIGIGLALILLFKKYYAFYDKKMGWQYPDRPIKEAKTEVYTGKKPLKEYFSLLNISLAILLVGAICTIVSAALGCINRSNWVAAMKPFKEAHGYYDDVMPFDVRPFIEPSDANEKRIEVIECVLLEKNYEVHYVDNQYTVNNNVHISSYIRFEGQLKMSRSGEILKIVETPKPPIVNDALAKMLFFVTDVMSNYPSEKTIVIEIPERYKDILTVRVTTEDAER